MENQFKGTKGEWKVVEHSWSDTSIVCGDYTVATKSIYYEATEDTQEELEDIVSNNFRLISCAPEMLEVLQGLVSDVDNLLGDHDIEWQQAGYLAEAKQLIKKATTI